MIGAIKIKDGLFIGDELASTVSITHPQALVSLCEKSTRKSRRPSMIDSPTIRINWWEQESWLWNAWQLRSG